MLTFVNANIPQEAKTALERFSETVSFSAPGLVYDAVSGHPDLFFVPFGIHVMVPPNLPAPYAQLLIENAITFITGQSPLGFSYPGSAMYNAVITPKYFIHNLRISDPLLLRQATGLKKIHVNQGYTRCNLLALGDTHFLTSDKGIFRTLKSLDMQVLFVEPKTIELPGFSHGFFGGACGILEKTVFICGNLKHHPQGEEIRKFIDSAGFSIAELYDGPLFDGGGVVFVGGG